MSHHRPTADGDRRLGWSVAALVTVLLAAVAGWAFAGPGGSAAPGGAAAAAESGCPVFPGDGGALGTVEDGEAVSATADRIHAAAEALPVDGFSGLVVFPGDRRVEVRWVGTVPPAMRDLAAREAQRGVEVAFAPGEYTRAQMLAAMERATSVQPVEVDPNWRGLMVAGAQACIDGGGIQVEVAQLPGGEPAADIPADLAVAIQQAAGDVQVWVEPGFLAVPLSSAGS